MIEYLELQGGAKDFFIRIHSSCLICGAIVIVVLLISGVGNEL